MSAALSMAQTRRWKAQRILQSSMKAVCDVENGDLAIALHNSACERGGDGRNFVENDLWKIGYKSTIVCFELKSHSLREVLVESLLGELRRLA